MNRARSLWIALLATFALAAAGLGLGAVAATAAPTTASLPVTSSTVKVSAAGRSYTATLVQPTGSAPGAYPVVAFGHGFLQGTQRYTSTLEALAAHGYVVVAPQSQGGILPNHSAFADDLWAAVVWARATQPNASPTLDAVAGHSMGGGAAVLAASRHTGAGGVDAVATLAAAETSPSAIAAAPSIAAPALYVTGSADGVVKPATTRAMYDATPSPATWVSITGGFHCGFLDSSSFFGIGCDSGQISRATQLSLSNGMLVAWLDATLKGGPAFVAPAGTTSETR